MRIYIGSDHRGFHLKKDVKDFLEKSGLAVTDVGDDHLDPNDDFPQFAARCVLEVLGSDDNEARGILICGSGQGMCMAANRFKGIRAALGYNKESARASREEDNSNILCLPSDVLEKGKWEEVVNTWVQTPFAGLPRYNRRIHELDELN